MGYHRRHSAGAVAGAVAGAQHRMRGRELSEGLRSIQGSLCSPGAQTKHCPSVAVWPAGHCATASPDIASTVHQSAGCILPNRSDIPRPPIDGVVREGDDVMFALVHEALCWNKQAPPVWDLQPTCNGEVSRRGCCSVPTMVKVGVSCFPKNFKKDSANLDTAPDRDVGGRCGWGWRQLH